MTVPFLKLTIFLGSFISFALEPLIGRTLLPEFGGTAAVWVTCLAAFQVLMVGGYFYAEKIRNFRLHLVLLLAAAGWCMFLAGRRGSVMSAVGAVTSVPHFNVLLTVLALCGIAFVLLSANSTVVQRLSGGDYRLYAWSNAGSMAGLLFYPFLFEPLVSLTSQWLLVAGGIVAYALLLWRVARGGAGTHETQGTHETVVQGRSERSAAVLWLLLPGVSCFLLNALTTHMTLDVMPMPLVWTLTLAIFLLSYVIGFSGRAERVRAAWLVGVLSCGLGLCVLCFDVVFRSVKFPVILALVCGFLFFACTFLHTWLYRIRPGAEELPRYNLAIAVGGAVGGVVASMVFPLMTRSVLEYPVALALVGALAVVGVSTRWGVGRVATVVAVMAGGVLYAVGARGEGRPTVYASRGFYGVVSVLEAKARTQRAEGRIHEYVHGTTVHGIQALLPGKERMPTTYYTPNASGYAIVAHPKFRKREPMRVNVTGLGVGILFCYGRVGDYYRAYEISEDALRVATDTNLFTFVSGCSAEKDIVLGDARKGLEAELAAGVEPYDVIVVDAFTGDNLPYHLSTVEAFDLYFKLLKPDGILCVNISNWHLGLEPFMKAVGEHYNCPLLGLQTRDDYGRLQFGAKIAIFCHEPSGLQDPPFGRELTQAYPIDFSQVKPMSELPTDGKGSFISLIRW